MLITHLKRAALAFTVSNIILLFILSCCTFMLSSCDLPDSITQATRVIDQGITDILARSDSWQSVLQQVSEKLPADISQIIRTEAQNLATRSIAQVGVEFRCNTDFLGRRAIEALRHLKEVLLGTGIPPSALPPAFCQVAPSSINLNDPPTSWSVVTFFGYDLDHLDSNNNLVGITLLNATGSIALNEDRIGRTTHYQLTINLGNMGNVHYSNGITKIVATWKNSDSSLPQVVVVPWTPAQKVETFNMGATPMMPPRVGGDMDFDTGDGEPTEVDVIGQVRVSGNTLQSRVYMWAQEVESDYTTVEGMSEWQVAYSAPPGWQIISYRPNANSEHKSNVTVHGELVYPQPGGEVVNRFHVWIDRDDDEAGVWTRMEVEWRPIEVTIQQSVPNWLK